MKHIIIGDLHGRDNWRTISIRSFDKIVFLGDYVDSDTLADLTILNNLKGLISLKKLHLEKVMLLLGNHDVQYLQFPHYQCRGSDLRCSLS